MVYRACQKFLPNLKKLVYCEAKKIQSCLQTKSGRNYKTKFTISFIKVKNIYKSPQIILNIVFRLKLNF